MPRRPFAFLLTFAAWALAAPAPPPADALDWRVSRSLEVMVPMRDGVRLSTLVKLPPEGEGPWSAIIQRTPYDKNRGATAGGNYTKHGYAYVIQDVRGLFASEGEYRAFENDQNDGYDTVEWIADQPWSTGKVGATGGSAGGIAATQAVLSRPPHLTCAYVTVSHGSSYRYANYSAGVFFQAMVEGWMKGRGIEPSPDPRPLMKAVHYYVMGDGMNGGKGPGNEWRTADAWPPPSTETRYYFQPAGGLSTSKPAGPGRDAYVYDPQNPAPTIGGPNLNISKGPMDQRPLRERNDILRYETAPLEEPVEVVGRVKAELWVSTDAEDTDFMVKLIDVYPNGYEAVLLDQPLRLRYRESAERWAKVKPGEVYPIEVDLWSTAQVFAPGHKIAVHVTSSNAPRFERHTNTWQPLPTYDEAVKARNTVFRSAERPSAIVLPVTNAPE